MQNSRDSNSLWTESIRWKLHQFRTGFALLGILICFGALWLCWNTGIGMEKSTDGKTISAVADPAKITKSFPALALTRADGEDYNVDAERIDLGTRFRKCTIKSGGNYRLTGSLNGQLYIEAEEQVVHLYLENAKIVSKSGPAIYVKSAGKLLITAVEGTENSISDSGDYRQEEDAEACIYAPCDLTINGYGSLKVLGLYKDAVYSSDILKLLNAQLTVRCKRTGFHGTDGILVQNADIQIESEKNGFRTTKKGRDGKGNIVITQSRISSIAGRVTFDIARADLYAAASWIYDKSIVDTYSVGGKVYIEEGCLQ